MRGRGSELRHARYRNLMTPMDLNIVSHKNESTTIKTRKKMARMDLVTERGRWIKRKLKMEILYFVHVLIP